ncbi:MAG: molybdopterin oxidoreductase family protein, partial [Bacteroidota bacterium]
ILNVIFAEDLVKLPLKDCVNGLDQLKSAIKDFSPAYVEEVSGFKAENVIKIARDFSNATSAVCYGRMGLSTQEYGGLCQWLGNVLNVVTGNFDSPGGALFNTPALDVVKTTGPKGTMRKFNRWQSKVRGLPEFNGELPSAAMAEEILDAGEHGIKAMITSAGNPVLSTPNGTRLDEAFEKLDFMVSIDIYLNETTRHADYILPPTTGLETDQYDIIFNLFAVRNVAKYSEALFKPSEGAMEDWQIFKSLADRLAPSKGIIKGAVDKMKTPERILDLGLRSGPYGHFKGGLTLKKLKNSPHGIDFGPLQPSLPGRLFTSDKKIDLAPEIFIEDLARLAANVKKDQGQSTGSELSLIGRRHLRSNNSWMHNSERLVKGGDRCTLLMNPLDAEKRELEDKQEVEVRSRVGSVRVSLEVSEEVMPGVVSLPHGWGHHRKGVGWKVAANHAGQSINDLTDHLMVDELTGNAAFSGVPVQVEST